LLPFLAPVLSLSLLFNCAAGPRRNATCAAELQSVHSHINNTHNYTARRGTNILELLLQAHFQPVLHLFLSLLLCPGMINAYRSRKCSCNYKAVEIKRGKLYQSRRQILLIQILKVHKCNLVS
jgi:hypothetical protein